MAPTLAAVWTAAVAVLALLAAVLRRPAMSSRAPAAAPPAPVWFVSHGGPPSMCLADAASPSRADC